MRFALILLLLISCSAPRHSEITGEVFVFTNGRETVKLSGAIVFVHDGIETDGYLSRSSESDPLKILGGMPKPVLVTAADANGQFKATMPRGKYYIVVFESRAVYDTTEFYRWLVPVDASKDVEVTLDNSNLLPTS